MKRGEPLNDPKRADHSSAPVSVAGSVISDPSMCEGHLRDRALFDLAIDSKLRGCDIVKMRIGDIASGGRIKARAIVVQQKTGRPVQF
jgi:hypothetical protein